jgi:hypothetical protein
LELRAATDGLKLQPVAIVTETTVAAVTDDALVGGLGGAFSGDVLAPGVSPLGAALVVAFQQVCHDREQQLLALAAFGVGVHGTGVVVLGQDHPQKVGSSAFVAATHLVHLGGAEQVAVLDLSKER